MNTPNDIDPAVYERLATSDLIGTITLLAGLVQQLPKTYQPILHDRIEIYRGFATSRKFASLSADDPLSLAMKGWILNDWADQARQIKEKIEAGLTRH